MCLIKAAFDCILNVSSVRNVFFYLRLGEIDFIGFRRGIVFSTGFTLSADRQEIVRLLGGHFTSTQ